MINKLQASSRRVKAVLIPGDGIGPEVASAVKHLFSESSIPVDWIEAQAGINFATENGPLIPEETIAAINEHGIALKGPTATPSGGGHQSINVLLRKSLGLFANVRPSKSLPSIRTRFSDVDLVIVRENVEDTYSGIEYMFSPEVAMGIKLISHIGSERVIRYAFDYALKTGRKAVCCVHKSNIHKFTDGLFLKRFNAIKTEYPQIESTDLLIDNVCMQMVTRPERFDVIVTPNLYGDILSDLCAGLVGGLGVAPSANIGNGVAVFEAVHGSAPDIAGKGIANPTALLLSAVMMLRHSGLVSYAGWLEDGLMKAFAKGLSTKDLGGELSTLDFMNSILDNLNDISLLDSSRDFDFDRAVRSYESRPLLDVDSRIDGVDIYIRSLTPPSLPKDFGSFKFHTLTNRGIRITAEDKGRDLVDIYCLRFISLRDQGASEKDISDLVSSLKLQVISVEFLQSFSGWKGYWQIN